MKQVFVRTVLGIAVFTLVVCLGASWQRGLASAATCPSPAPTCTTSGALTDLSASYACTSVRTDSDGTVKTAILLVNSLGNGTGSVLIAQNDNSTSTTTYQDFTAQTFNYCVNTNDTGYLTPTGECPVAFVIDDGKTEVRLLNSAENRAELLTCKKQ
jgi:hypothetical protein